MKYFYDSHSDDTNGEWSLYGALGVVADAGSH
jgi:hypothetical protein